VTKYLVDLPVEPHQMATWLSNAIRRDNEQHRIYNGICDTEASKARNTLVRSIRTAKPAEVVLAHDPECETLLATANEATSASRTAASYHASLYAQLKVDNERLRNANKSLRAERDAKYERDANEIEQLRNTLKIRDEQVRMNQLETTRLREELSKALIEKDKWVRSLKQARGMLASIKAESTSQVLAIDKTLAGDRQQSDPDFE
jgi:hypothetical protein